MCFLNTNVTSTNALWANVQARMSSTDYALDYNSTNRFGVIKKVVDIRQRHSLKTLVALQHSAYGQEIIDIID